jgi:hypothetical protein
MDSIGQIAAQAMSELKLPRPAIARLSLRQPFSAKPSHG